MMKGVIVLIIFLSTLVYGAIINKYSDKTIPCIDHQKENITSQKEQETIKMIDDYKDIKLIIAIDKYEEALEKKREMMMKLWTVTARIEHLMRQNQLLRKEIIKHWEGVKQSQSVSK